LRRIGIENMLMLTMWHENRSRFESFDRFFSAGTGIENRGEEIKILNN